MKTLNELINEAIERFEKEYVVKSNAGTGLLRYTDADKIKQWIKTELSNIIKESFKNTRVEEKEMRCLECADSAECECRNNNFSYRLAISDKHNKENQFLNN